MMFYDSIETGADPGVDSSPRNTSVPVECEHLHSEKFKLSKTKSQSTPNLYSADRKTFSKRLSDSFVKMRRKFRKKSESKERKTRKIDEDFADVFNYISNELNARKYSTKWSSNMKVEQ